MKYTLSLLAALLAASALPSFAQNEPKGDWQAPAKDGSPWDHKGSSLSFPQRLGEYRMAGVFTYAAGGALVRYEDVQMRARADIFVFPASAPAPTMEDKHRMLLKEMDTVVADMNTMVQQGRYKNLQIGDVLGSEIELWRRSPLPLAVRTITATRLGASSKGAEEAIIQQWIGITLVQNHLVTIRHMRPADTGERGEADLKTFVGSLLQVIKDPALREEIKGLISGYMANPFAPESDDAAGAVLAYLDQTPFLPVYVPEHPISSWLERIKTVAPGDEAHLLRGFMLGSAEAALNGEDPAQCVNAGARQFAKIYRHLVAQHPAIAGPEIDAFAAAAEKGEGADWLQKHGQAR